jgi:hypothetical protein
MNNNKKKMYLLSNLYTKNWNGFNRKFNKYKPISVAVYLKSIYYEQNDLHIIHKLI